MNKKLPKFKNDKAVENFMSKNVSDYLTQKNFSHVSFEFAPKDKPVTMRMPGGLLDTVKKAAKKQGVNYQRLMRQAIEHYVTRIL